MESYNILYSSLDVDKNAVLNLAKRGKKPVMTWWNNKLSSILDSCHLLPQSI